MQPELKNVTICAVDCVNVKLAIAAIRKSFIECSFEDAIIFTDKKENLENIRFIEISKINSREDYSRFILKELPSHIKTTHVLIVQWDGFVINGNQWSNQFLEYDYIGAKWPWLADDIKVGNGGFSLRSKKLLNLMAQDQFPFLENMNEDQQICQHYRKKLELNHKILFANVDLADKFSYERHLPNLPTFGFHGLFNFWRYFNDDEIIEIAASLNPSTVQSIDFFELMMQYFMMRKFKPFMILYSYVKKYSSSSVIYEKLFLITKDKQFSSWFIKTF